MYLAFGECDGLEKKGLKIMGGVRYRVQLEIEIDLEDHAISKYSHSIVSMALFFHRQLDNDGEE